MKINIQSIEKKRVYDEVVNLGEVYAPCGGKGICGKCKLKTVEGKFNEITERERKFLTKEELDNNIRLACYLYFEGSAVVEIEEREGKKTEKIYKEFSEEEEYTVICDLGTTTVEIEIYDKESKLAAEIKFLNPQRKYGNDIISRAEFGAKSIENINIMKNKLIEKINDIKYIKKCKNFYIAGNSVMQQIFLGVNTQNFLEPPYNPVFYEKKIVSLKEFGIKTEKDGNVTTLENIGGFVGGDSRAIVDYYSRNLQNEKIFLVIDLGTNGEILLFKENMIYASSTAAGPAFEAITMECGMNAAEGAVSSVSLENGVKLEVIGDIEPRGICGSGYISLISELLYTDTIDKNGNFVEKNLIFPEINKNIFAGKFELSQYIYISQKDIREIQTAKSAIAATIEILLEESQIDKKNVEKIVITGNFGGKVTTKNVEKCKILPLDINAEIKFEPNLVLEGLRSMFIEKKKQEVNYKIFHIKTAQKADFEKKFIKNMFF